MSKTEPLAYAIGNSNIIRTYAIAVNAIEGNREGNRVNEVFGKFRIQTCALMAFPNPRGWQDDRKESETLFTRFP